MEKIIERRKKLREKTIQEASQWSAKIPSKTTAILVGSYARGDFNLWSDIDILLISENFKGRPLKRLKTIDAPQGFQIIPLTPNEFKRLLTKKHQLAIEAAEHGIILRDDLKLVQQTKEPANLTSSKE